LDRQAAREIRGAALFARGMSGAGVVARLQVQIGTVRNQLKGILEKSGESGIGRRGELIALPSRREF
jgi:DNA-binding NarL/FixJ family response regulator